jgi:GalNAc-alpha-(1->4)-GalNAc-alpha-(1->3)-diNAcBac-PP-undecaprenol alpha-1,4-N-acetyl-D-galactosaminyltransferase
MRITFVIASLRGGGSERATVNLANYWAARGWTPTIITIYHRGVPPAFPLHPGVVHRDLDWELPPGERPVPSPEMLRQIDAALAFFSPASRLYLLQHRDVLAMLRQAIVESRPEAVVSMINSTNIRTIAATRGLGVRVFVSERGIARAYTHEKLRLEAYLMATAVVALTPGDLAYYVRKGVRRGCAIPNAVLPRGVPPRDGRNGARVLASLGRLSWEKGYDLLIKSFAKVADAHPSWTLEIWGRGGDREKLEEYAAQLGVADRVTLGGFTADTDDVLARADLYVQPSRREGFPNALCEAMASGLPVVAFASSPGVRMIVRDGVDGVLVPKEQVGSLARTLDRLMRDEAERTRLAARAPEVVQRFSVDEVMRRWEELLRWPI